jgi:hypothetical protein
MTSQTQLQVFEVSVVSAPQEFQVTLSGVDYRVRITWCWPIQCWIMDMYDASTLDPILLGNAVVTGADLLAQFAYLGFPGLLVVQTDHDRLAQPTFDNLGTLSHIFYIPSDQGATNG